MFDYLKNLRFISVWMASSLSQSKKQELARKGVIVIDQNLE